VAFPRCEFRYAYRAVIGGKLFIATLGPGHVAGDQQRNENHGRKVGDHFLAKVVRTLSAHLVSREVEQPTNVLIAASVVLAITAACQCPRPKVQNLRIVLLIGFHPTISADKNSNARITIPSETRPSRGP
jgi:hypothetical protein